MGDAIGKELGCVNEGALVGTTDGKPAEGLEVGIAKIIKHIEKKENIYLDHNSCKY